MDKYPLIMKGLAVGIILLFGVTSIIPSTAQDREKSSLSTSSGNWLYVGGSGSGNYSKIQNAIDNASDGDTVFVYSGIYYENIDINKSIDVFGQNKETTIIEGKLNDDIIHISVDFVNLSGFSILSDWEHEPFNGINLQSNNTRIIDNIIKTDDTNINLYLSNDNTITHNIILNTNIATALTYSNYNNISSNTISNTNVCIELFHSSSNMIALNNLSSNNYEGIFLHTSCNYNAIYRNKISKIGWDGIELFYSDNNFIAENNINSINETGIRISPYSHNNSIYHNNLWDNGVNAYDQGQNIWDDDYPSGGNYWDDYTGTDTNGDDIGDVRYNITGGINQDRYPFIRFDGWKNQPPVFGIPTPANGSANNPLSFTWGIPINDTEGDQFSWTIQCSNGQTNGRTSATNGIKSIALSGLTYLTTYKVWVNATDPDGSGLYTRKWYTFTTKANHPTNVPTITGPAKGKVRVATEYNFTTIDPDGDEVYYFIDWGDNTSSGWLGPYPSGEKITESHAWSKKTTYMLKAKAKDLYGNESSWAILTVTMPCSYDEPILQFWDLFFQRFPNVFPILRQLLGY